MLIRTLTFLAGLLSVCTTAVGTVTNGGFCPGTGAEVRISTNYIIADTLGQFVVGQSMAPDNSYSCAIIEHGFWHSDIWISSLAAMKQEQDYAYVDAYAKVVTAGTDQFSRNFYIADQSRLGG